MLIKFQFVGETKLDKKSHDLRIVAFLLAFGYVKGLFDCVG